MDITPDLLRNEIVALEAKQTQQIAELNTTGGALQVLHGLLQLATKPVALPGPPPADPVVETS